MAEYSKLKVADLKQLLVKRGVEADGTRKQQMIDALISDDNDAGIDTNADAQDSNSGRPGKKRAASSAFDIPDSKQPKLESNSVAQYVNSSARVPVDENCHLGGYQVYIDPSNIVWDAALNQTNASNNNNKFYRIQVLHKGNDFRTWTRWGRVAENGQSATLGNGKLDDALKNFEDKFKSKTGLKWADRGSGPKSGKYVFVEKNYADDDDEPQATAGAGARPGWKAPKCSLEPEVKSLMELIFNQKYFAAAMVDLNYDAAKLPLGKLSKATITRGFQALKDLSAILDDPSLVATSYGMPVDDAIEDLSNLYYSLIPHAFGRNRPPVIQYSEQLKGEVDLLESLSDLKAADDIIKADKGDVEEVHPLDHRFKGLGMREMTPVSPLSDEFSELSNYLTKTCGSTHSVNYQVQDIFRIEREGEVDRFQKSGFAEIKSDRRLLWHGSRATNYGGILGQGVRIAPPEAPVSGYMFGKGIYLADMSSKSANYCCSYASGGTALLLLCEAELGAPMQQLLHADPGAGEEAKKKGLYSTWGQGEVGPQGWKDAGAVHPSLAGVQMPDTTKPPCDTEVDAYLQYNEYICYDVAQVRLRYLLRVKM